MKSGSPELKSLEELERIVATLGRLIGACKSDLPTMGQSTDFAHPSVEVDENGYHYVVVERGREIQRETTNDLDQLLFWIFENVSFSIAIKRSLTPDGANSDQRRAYFATQVELLGELNPKWAEAVGRKQSKVLEQFPFDDFASTRARYCKQLRDEGLPNEDAWEAACEKYPLKRASGAPQNKK